MEQPMKTEEQLHVEFLQQKAANLGLSFADYMLFLMFETLEHSTVLNNGEGTGNYEPVWAQEYRNMQSQAQNEADGL
jgi:hypothetical protein